jgi:hypothetical protein
MEGARENPMETGSREWLLSLALIQTVVVTAILWSGQGAAWALAGL